jgi:hypothetical protein
MMVWTVRLLVKRPPRSTPITEHERRSLILSAAKNMQSMIQTWAGEPMTHARIDRLNRHLRNIRRLLGDGQPKARLTTQERITRAQLRSQVFQAYGGRCQCCGESDPRVLTLDHITPCRGQRSKDIYKDAIRLGFPRDVFQTLCLNCNQLKGTDAVCPHQQRKDEG